MIAGRIYNKRGVRIQASERIGALASCTTSGQQLKFTAETEVHRRVAETQRPVYPRSADQWLEQALRFWFRNIGPRFYRTTSAATVYPRSADQWLEQALRFWFRNIRPRVTEPRAQRLYILSQIQTGSHRRFA